MDSPHFNVTPMSFLTNVRYELRRNTHLNEKNRRWSKGQTTVRLHRQADRQQQAILENPRLLILPLTSMT